MLRFFVGVIIGVFCGAVIGATSFAVAENFFGRGIGILTSSPKLAAIFGVFFMGAPSLVVGVIVSGFKTNLIHSLIIGFVTGITMVLLFVAGNESKYFYESGYFDKDLFWNDVITNATWLIGLPLTAMIVSASVRALFPQNK